MTPKKFYIGQAVTPINNEPWVDVSGRGPSPIKFGEVYHVKGYKGFSEKFKSWGVLLEEIPLSYDQDDLAPVISTNQLYKDLKEETVTIEH